MFGAFSIFDRPAFASAGFHPYYESRSFRTHGKRSRSQKIRSRRRK